MFEAGDELCCRERSAAQLRATYRREAFFVGAVGLKQLCEVAHAFEHGLHDNEPVVAAREMRTHAGPRPLLRPRNKECPHRIERDIAHGRDEMGIVHRHRREAVLKEMSGPPAARIDEAGIAAMRLADGLGETFLLLRHDDEMDVVGHQTIGPNLDVRLLCLLGQEITVNLLIAILEEDGLAPVAALGNVMRAVGHNDAGNARHAEMLCRTPAGA